MSSLPDSPLSAWSLPAAWYHDPHRYLAERRDIFGRAWLLVGHESELAENGATVSERLAGWPIFVRRDSRGQVHGFHNVCQHRAGPIAAVARDGSSQACHMPRLRCRYHGWLYREDGRVERSPGFAHDSDTSSIDPCSLRLKAIRVDIWRGFIFVCLDDHAPPLAQALGRLVQVCEDFALESFQFHSRVSHTVQCNWKTYLDNYLEGYHIPFVHPQLVKELDWQSARVHAEDAVVTYHYQPRADSAGSVYAGLWAWLWPNLTFNLYGDGLSVERMLPLSPTTMKTEYLFFFRPGADPAGARAMAAQLTDEDRQICEAVQSNLEAGVFETGPLSPRHETGVGYFHSLVRARAALGED